MKKLKSLIIYGVIIALGIAAFGGYLFSKWDERNNKSLTAGGQTTNSLTQKTEGTSATAANGSGSAGSTDESTNIPANTSTSQTEASTDLLAAKLLKTDADITGRSEEDKQKHIKAVMEKSVELPDPDPVVGIGRGEDFGKVTAAAIENAGGLKDIVKKGDVVLIKPNLCVQIENYGSSRTTDYRVVQEVINEVLACGASRVVVAEGNFASNCFENLGNRYVNLEGAMLYNFNDCEKEDCYQLDPKGSLVGWGLLIPKIYMDADVVIDVAKLKTHGMTGVTLGLKNNFGVPSYRVYGGGGSKSGLHSMGISETIVSLCKVRRPEFTIIDGIIGGEGYGPAANTPVKSNIIIASKDIVSADTVGLTFMGFKVDDIEHVKLAGEQKVGISDINKIMVKGADLDSIKMKFVPAY